MNTLLFKFLWDNKPDKARTNSITYPTRRTQYDKHRKLYKGTQNKLDKKINYI